MGLVGSAACMGPESYDGRDEPMNYRCSDIRARTSALAALRQATDYAGSKLQPYDCTVFVFATRSRPGVGVMSQGMIQVPLWTPLRYSVHGQELGPWIDFDIYLSRCHVGIRYRDNATSAASDCPGEYKFPGELLAIDNTSNQVSIPFVVTTHLLPKNKEPKLNTIEIQGVALQRDGAGALQAAQIQGPMWIRIYVVNRLGGP